MVADTVRTRLFGKRQAPEPVDPRDAFPLVPPLPLPDGVDEETLRAFLSSLRIDGEPTEVELANYFAEDFHRFVRTWALVRDRTGRALELGGNPYFTTLLLKEYTDLDLTLANYFGPDFSGPNHQTVTWTGVDGAARSEAFEFAHFNIEDDPFPFDDGAFDVVLFCEIVEHLLMNPVAVLTEIKRVLRPGGLLVLTTPNVNRLENVARMVAGANIYDPYSGYGPYGRHNREFNKHELYLLLTHLGFSIESLESADVHENRAETLTEVAPLVELLRFRERDLGQYLFCAAVNTDDVTPGLPSWLFRSHDPSDMAD
jgi:SAM-dependent methyltransferase